MNAPAAIATLQPDRSRFLGGSDMAAVMGLSPWATPVELWMQKTGRAPVEPIDPAREKRFARGKKLEPFIIDMVIDKLRAEGHEVELIRCNERYTDPEYPFLSCEIDMELMLDGEHINGDAKSVHGFARKKWGEEDTEDVPIEYAAQFMHGLMVTGRRRCLVAALSSFDDVGIYWVNRDDETIAAMREKAVRFWIDHVQGDTPPDPIEFSDIKALFPLDDGAAVEATQEVADKVLRLAGIKSQIKDLEEAESILQFDIAEFISPHALLTHGGKEIASWKAQQARRFDQKRFAEAHPDLVSKFTNVTTSRVLRLKKGK
jgi:putative phage-type endonuclease